MTLNLELNNHTLNLELFMSLDNNAFITDIAS